MSESKIENVFDSLQRLTSAEQENVLKRLIDNRQSKSDKPTYAEIVSGAKSSRPSTPEPVTDNSQSASKRLLHSPETPHKGKSRKVFLFFS
jgi:hypothetical protein